MKYGVFGGSFNPPHNEHKNICETAKKELGLDKIILLPCGNAPHKTNLVPFEKRCEMLSILFGKDIIIDDIENRIDGLTNSARILPMLKDKYGDIVFIIGGDSMIAMDRWIEPIKVMTTCPVAVVSREEKSKALIDAVNKYRGIGSDITILDYVGSECSSTMIRTFFELALTPPMIPNELSEYIKQNKLYSTYSDMLEKVSKRLPEKRLAHTKEVVLMAIRLNFQLGLPYEKVFISALLHDIAKYSDKKEVIYDNMLFKEPVAHAFVGAELAQDEFGIEDKEILNAIRYHTTGRANMSTLEKLIYLSDYIEETRNFDQVAEIRALSLKNFNDGFIQAVTKQMKFLEGKENISPLTSECYNYYTKTTQSN